MTSYEERLDKRIKQKERMETRAKQLSEEIKRIERRHKEEHRKKRTHYLVILGAEISKLFHKDYLEEEEIAKVVRYLKVSMERDIKEKAQKENKDG